MLCPCSFCVFLLRGSFWSLFGIFYLFWVGLGGHLRSPWCPIGGGLLFSWSLLGPVGSLWEPLGTHVLLWGSFWGSCGILGSLFGSLGGPVGSILAKLAIPQRMLPEQTELTIPRGWKAGEELPEQTNWRYLAKRCLSRQNWPFHPRGRP